MTARNLLGELALEATQAEVRDTLTGLRTASGKALAVGNALVKFRDGFASAGEQPDPAVWTLVNDHPGEHLVMQGGDSAGSSYLRISMSPFVDNSSVWLTSTQTFRLPTRVGWGISASQRILGQEFLFGVAEAGDDAATGLNRAVPAVADVPITGSVQVTSNVGNFPVAAGHPFRPGDRVIVVGAADTRLNVGPVVVTSGDATSVALPVVQSNGTFTATGGAIRYADPLGRANNGAGLLLENTTTTNASLTARRNGTKPRVRNANISTTTAAAPSSWSDGFLAPSVHEQFLTMEEFGYRSFAVDSNSGMSGMDKLHQGIPDEELDYRLVVRARNLDDLSRPIARIVSISKSGSTTATVTTDRPHGLTTLSRVGIYGVRDQTNYGNQADVGFIAAVPSATTFTTAFGASATGTNLDGGVVYLNHGGVTSPGAIGFAIQSIARTNGVLVVTLNTTASGFIPGEYLHLWGMNGGGAAAYEGAYKVLRQAGSTVELASPGPDFAAITTGGAIIRRTEYRLHFVRVLDHTRHYVEVLGGRASQNDGNNAVPVSIAASTTVTVNNATYSTEVIESTTNLAASGLYTGATRDTGSDLTRGPSRLRVAIRHLAGIVPGSVYLEQSTDNSSYYETWRCPIPSDAGVHTFEVPLHSRYYRWRFQNGATAQTSFWFQTRRALLEGPIASDITKVLWFPVTALAGQAIAAGATVYGTGLDLGHNHNWRDARLFYRTDTAGQTAAIEQSMDGTTWFWAGGAVPASAASGVASCLIAGRYVRAFVRAEPATASTLSFGQLALAT